MTHHRLTLVAPVLQGSEAAALEQLGRIFEDVHLVPRRTWTPALAGSIEPFLARRLRWLPGLELSAASALLRRICALGHYDLVHVRQLPMAEFGRSARARSRLLELVDSETLGAERASPMTARRRLRARIAAKVEQRALRGFDAVTTVAEADAVRVRALDPSSRVEVVPNGVDTGYFRPEPRAGESASLVFVGAMSYPPNVAAMRYFTSSVLPDLQRWRDDVRLTIVGRDPSAAVLAMSSPTVEVTGPVEDVRPFLASGAAFVAPMVSGSGIKNKVLEAMAMALPVVATSLAVEGLPVRDGENALVADDAHGFAAAIRLLLDDPVSARRIGRAGRELVQRDYTWEACAERYDRLYHELVR
ncbi:MAG TPA: glycosyltransferase [Candidatus Limnocylindria bacterium]|nr:glycosyltransferase [Candidatus Limnocylindria bacterium]